MSARSLFEEGYRYYDGSAKGYPDYRSAKEKFEKAAAMGNANAMVMLSFLYSAGKGVMKDDNAAFAWSKKAIAADPEHPDALHNLGQMYMYGRGISADMEMAVRYFGNAARVYAKYSDNYNYGQCHNQMGLIYEFHYKNYEFAYKHFLDAAITGKFAAAWYNVGRMIEDARVASQYTAKQCYDKCDALGGSKFKPIKYSGGKFVE